MTKSENAMKMNSNFLQDAEPNCMSKSEQKLLFVSKALHY
jgi:hypothetical protein